MSDVDRIAEALEGIFATWINGDGVCQILVDGDYDGIEGRPIGEVAAEIYAALHPRIDTIDQLDTLPHGAVVRASADGPNGSVYEKDLQYTQRGEPWWPSGYDVECASDDIQLPAILLYTPESS